MQNPPRHLGLPRRQSYDPLSSSKLSLGTLPAPSFGGLPSGQRSVPAVEYNRRNISGSINGEPVTPGGSLVIGSEIFGFGTSRSGKERWGSQKNDDTDETKEGDDWPEQFDVPATAAAAAAAVGSGSPAVSKATLPGSGEITARTLRHSENRSADFTLGGLPRPSLKTYGSSASLRGTVVEPPPPADVTTPSAAPSGVPTPSGFYGFDPSPPPPLPQAVEDLAYGFGSINLGGNGNGNGTAGAGASAGAGAGRGGGGAGEYRSGGPRRQGSGHQQGARPPPQPYAGGYFIPPPHLGPDGYMSYGGDFFPSPSDLNGAAAGGMGAGRRDSGYASPPSPYQRQPWALGSALPAPDYSVASTQSSRHGSFSYSPALPSGGMIPYALAPGAPFDPSAGPAFSGIGQQQQILLGRGLRSNVEYIAPGPPPSISPVPSGPYGGFYQPQMFMGGGGGGGRYDDMRPIRSPLLEEFRTNRHRSWELGDLANHIVEFSGDQLGSRHIQTKLESATSDEKQMVFDEILPNMLQLSTDVFANYVIQKFFEQGNQAQKTALANVLEGHVLELSLQMYGCRVVQKALEYVLVDQQVRLVKELDGHILKCARDAQSNHVVQRALERVPSDKITFITDACVGQVHSLATHPYGCRVLQRIFENCPPAQTRVLLDELHRHTQGLIQDQYGNASPTPLSYVVQWVIEKGERPDKSLVVAKVFGQVLPLAQQKFASNVIEKCIVFATDDERRRLIDEVLTPAADGSSVVKAMLVHPYANYVMQKMLHTAVGPQRDALFAQTSVQLAALRKFSTSYSKHLIAIEKLLSSERARTGPVF